MNIEEEINKIYMNILKRRVNVNERKKYTEMYQEYLDSNGNQGLSLNQIEDIIYSSDEYKNKNKPKPTPKEATHDINGNILKRNTTPPVSNEPIPLPVMPPIITPKSKEIKKLNAPIIIEKEDTENDCNDIKKKTQDIEETKSTHKEKPVIVESTTKTHKEKPEETKTTHKETPVIVESTTKTTHKETPEETKTTHKETPEETKTTHKETPEETKTTHKETPEETKTTHKETPVIVESTAKTTHKETPEETKTTRKETPVIVESTTKTTHKETPDIKEVSHTKEFQEVKNEERKREELKKKQNMIKIIGERSKIHIFLLVRDNENTLEDTFNKLSEIEKMNITKYEFHYWILENDSKDNTVNIVKEFLKTKSGRIISGKLGTKKWTNVKQENRVKDMTYYRNLNLKMMFLGPMKPNTNIMDINDLAVLENAVNFKNEKWKPYRSKYSIILDTNIVFEKTIFEEMETILEQNNDVGMITPFGYVRTSPMTYYDTYALQTMDNKNQANKEWIKNTNKKTIYDIKSGFSGFVLLKTDLLKKSKWKFINANLSEHVGFCESIRSQNKRVVICPAIKVGWTP